MNSLIHAVVNMREQPTDQSKVVSQAIFSEQINVIEILNEWSLISTPDKYQGWIRSHTYVKMESSTHTHKISRLAAHLYGVKDTEFGPLLTLPYGSTLKAEQIDERWLKVFLHEGQEAYIQCGDVETNQQTLAQKEELVLFSYRFLGLPYTWGGRSSFGYDCSGFVQMLYNQIGIHLPRDAYQQATDSRFCTIEIESLEPGDLIFFGNGEQAIKHVGLAIGEGRFIHATAKENQPWIRISALTDDFWSGSKDGVYPFRLARRLLHSS